MRFFLFFLFFYFNTFYTYNLSTNYLDSDRNNELFSNYIRLNLDKIPFRNNLVTKNFDVSFFNFKKKPKKTNINSYDNSDSKIDNINEDMPLIISSSNVSTKIKKEYPKNNTLLKKNNEFDFKKNFKQVAINVEDKERNSTNLNIIDTINKAVSYNPKIKAQESSFESSKEKVKQVYSAIFPSLEMNLSKSYKDTDSKTTTTTTNESSSPQDFSINLEQNLYTGGKFTAEAKKAKSQLLIEEENIRLAKYEVILESALAYLEVLEKKKLIELNNLKEEKFKNDFESINLLVEVGNASQSDLVFAQSKLVQVAAEKIASINDFNVTKANYKKVVGELLPNSDLEEPKINKLDFPDNFDQALNMAFKNSPTIKIAQLEETIAKYDIKSQFADALPNLSLDAEYQSSDDVTSKGSSSDTAEITANITIPLFKGGKNISKIKEAKIIAKKVRFELENKRNEVTHKVTESWTNFQTSETLLKAANINIEARKLILEGTEQEAKLGMKSYIDLLQSREDLIDAEFNKITATKNYIFSALQLKADIGELSLKDLYI
tara:strand:- start:4641 stop:6287 length:1647 start_codon:yes stop_codon:yes gene_type:complete